MKKDGANIAALEHGPLWVLILYESKNFESLFQVKFLVNYVSLDFLTSVGTIFVTEILQKYILRVPELKKNTKNGQINSEKICPWAGKQVQKVSKTYVAEDS